MITAFLGEYQSQALLISALLVLLALFFVPFMLILNGIYTIQMESLSLSNALSLILGIIIAFGEAAAVLNIVFSDYINDEMLFKYTAIISGTVIYFSLWILAFVLYVFSMQYIPHRMNFNYIIIHGCGLIDGKHMSKLLSNRVDKAIEVYNKCKVKPKLIPSGGRGDDEDIEEAAAMTQYLLEHGIPECDIIPESRSKTTMENLQYSKDIIEQRDGPKKTALISSNYHIYRCLLFASRIRFKCTGIGAKVAFYYWPSATLREFAAVFTKLPHIIWLILGFVITVLIPSIVLIMQ